MSWHSALQFSPRAESPSPHTSDGEGIHKIEPRQIPHASDIEIFDADRADTGGTNHRAPARQELPLGLGVSQSVRT